MSTLQLSLAIVGGLVLAMIVAYNTWTSRRNAPRQPLPLQDEGPVGTNLTDPVLRQEPAFDMAAPLDAAPSEPLAHGPVPASHVVGEGDDAMALPVHQSLHERRAPLDPLIDVIAPLGLDHAVSGEAALAAMPPTRRAGSKPFAIDGLNEATQQWEAPVPGQRYAAFQAGVQLANRMGAINEIEFSEFVMKTQAFADTLNAAPDFPDMLQEVARARELDQFASEHDAQLAFMLRALHATWSPGFVQQAASRLGFVAGAIPGRLVLPAATVGLPPVLTLSFDTQAALSDEPETSAVREVVLSLDVAQVHRTEQPFARLREVADALCASMDGVLCDQNGTPLPAMAMDPIAGDLEVLYDKLDSRDLSAGSLLARRLFS